MVIHLDIRLKRWGYVYITSSKKMYLVDVQIEWKRFFDALYSASEHIIETDPDNKDEII